MKKQNKTYKPMAIAALFCAAAGIYAKDDGWQYKDSEKTIIENTGAGTENRLTPLAKGEYLNNKEEIEHVSNVEIASGSAKYVYDTTVMKETKLDGIVLDGEAQSVSIASGAELNVDVTKDDLGAPVNNQSSSAIIFSEEATSASLNGDGTVVVKAANDAVAIESKGEASVDISAKKISAESTIQGNAVAIDVKNAGTISVETLSATANDGSVTALKAESAGDVTIGAANAGISIKDAMGDVTIGAANADISIDNAMGDVTIVSGTDVKVGNIAADKTVKVDEASGTVSVAGEGNLTVGKANKIELTDDNSLGGKLTVTEYAENIDVNSLGAADVQLQDTEFKANEVKGDAKFNGKGNVEIGNAGSVTVASGDSLDGSLTVGTVGNINVDTITGDTTITTATGDVAVNVGANVSVEEAQGKVTLGDVDNVTLGNVAGDIDIVDAGAVKIGQVNASAKVATSDSVEATMASGGILDAGDTTSLTAKVEEGTTNVYVKANSATNVDLQTLGGTTKIDAQKIEYQGDVNGEISSLANNGNVTLSRVDVLEVKNGTQANITVDSTKTSVDVDSLAGDLVIKKASASGVTVTNSTGNVTVGLNSANLTATNITGNVDVKSVEGEGDVIVDSVSGKVTTSGDLNGKLTASNVSGKIDTTAGKLGSADISLNGNDFNAAVVSGDAKLSGVGNVVIKDAGSITVAEGDKLDGTLNVDGALQGNSNIAEITGKTTISDIKENATLTIGKGADIDISGAGNLNVETSAGKITAGDLGNINAENATVAGIESAGKVGDITVG
ncbi:beta strand repeat-containing protein, partial [Intestinicryptomonas porci]|nr:hypothetical protein [Opitutales bacterium CLA-KB-P66]